MELLELQARARAIRSQLALEPVTKIEVDTDGEDAAGGTKEAARKRKSNDKERSRHNSTSASTSKQIKTNGSHSSNGVLAEATASSTSSSNANVNGNSEDSSEKVFNKKIKLKRSYRKSSPVHNQQSTEQNATVAAEANAKEEKQERTARSASPDVIPIVAEPETLMISDSSDEERKQKKNKYANATKESTAATKPQSSNSEQAVIETTAAVEQNKETNDKTADKPTKISESEPEEGEVKDTPTETAAVLNATVEVQKQKSQRRSSIEQTANITAPVEQDDEHDDVISLEGGDLESEMTEHLEEDIKPVISTLLQHKHVDAENQPIDDEVISLSEEEASGNERNSESNSEVSCF